MKYDRDDIQSHQRAVWAMDRESIDNLQEILDHARVYLDFMESKRRNRDKEFAILFKLTYEVNEFDCKAIAVISGISEQFKIGEV